MDNETKIQLQQELINLYESQIMDLTMMSKIELGDDVIEEIKRLKDLITISPTYSIPIYENGIKTEWTVDGVVGDEKYFKLLEFGNGKDLPDIINTNKKNNK